MHEKSSPTAVFYGSAKAEQRMPPKKEKKTIVETVKNAAANWLDRVGPKGVENHFLQAHANVLKILKPSQQKDVLARELQKWRTTGEVFGIAATVIDTSLIAFGMGVTASNWNRPQNATNAYRDFVYNALTDHGNIHDRPNLLTRLFMNAYDVHEVEDGSTSYTMSPGRINTLGHTLTSIPAIAATGALVAGGPAHWLANKAAEGMETYTKNKIRTTYEKAKKAAESAQKVAQTKQNPSKNSQPKRQR